MPATQTLELTSARSTPAEQLFLLLFYAVTGEGGDLPWSPAAAVFLDLATEYLELTDKKKWGAADALAGIDYAITLAARVGAVL